MKQSTPSKEWIRKRVIDEILFKPALSLLPAFVGLPVAIAPWVLEKPNFMASAIGVAVSLLSVGIYATRVCLNWGDEDALKEKILQQAAREAETSIQKKLIATRLELVMDGDSTTENMFDRLIALQEILLAKDKRSKNDLDRGEVIAQVGALVEASVDNLTESARLLKKAKVTKIATVQAAIDAQRLSLLEETQHSIAAIEKILLAVVRNQQTQKKSETSRIRQELEAQLEISERVKQRMDSWSVSQSKSQL